MTTRCSKDQYLIAKLRGALAVAHQYRGDVDAVFSEVDRAFGMAPQRNH